jgi:branched-chain amino acid transport system substrate-binding protein
VRASKPVVLLAGAAFILTACGTRLPNSAFEAKTTKNAASSSDSSAGAQGNVGDAGASGDTGATGDTGAASTGGTTSGATTGGAAAATTRGGSSSSSGNGGGGTAAVAGEANTASDVGVTPTSITIGAITAIQGIFGPEAFGVSQRGLQVFVKSINDRGGINGRKLQLVTCDDRENAAQNLQCAQQLIEQDKVFAMIGGNSDASARSAKYINDKGVPRVSFPLDSGFYKYPHAYSIYPYAGYPRDGKTVGVNGTVYQLTASYRWFKQEKKIDKAAVFFYTIAVSQAQGYAVENDLKAEGVQTAYEGGGSHSGENPAAPSFDTDVVNMRQAGVQGIWDAIDIGANQKMCEAMDRQNFHVAAKVSTIQSWGQQVGTSFHAPCRDSVYTTGYSHPYSETSNPAVQQFLADVDKYNPSIKSKMHQWTLEGYAIGVMFADGIKSLGAKPTRAGFETWLRGVRDYTGGGFFGPRDWRLPDYTKPATECTTIVQWDSARGTMAIRAPLDYCATTRFIGYQPSNDGA